jgi:hypothetical protein
MATVSRDSPERTRSTMRFFSSDESRRCFRDAGSLRALVECIGAIASERPSLASGIVGELVKPRLREIWSTLATRSETRRARISFGPHARLRAQNDGRLRPE